MSDAPVTARSGRPLRILFLIRSLDFGGAQRQLTVLADGLARRGHHVAVVTFYDGAPLLGPGARPRFRHDSLGKRSRWDLVLPVIRLIRLLRAANADVVHGYLTDANVVISLTAWVAPKAKVVWGLRGSGVDFGPTASLAGRLFRVSRWLSSRPDLVISNSNAAAASHSAAGYRAKRVVVIPNGVDTEVFRPDPMARDRQRAGWGLAPTDWVIGLVARIDPMKGHRIFLQAVARYAADGLPGTFVCIGNGPPSLASELASYAMALGVGDRVRWFPAHANAGDLYNALDVLTTASLPGEGCPNVVAEAMACGTFCVVTNSGDSAALVGDTGVVVPAGDPLALAAAWGAAWNGRGDPRRTDPRRRIETEYGVDLLVARTESTLRDLVDGSNGGHR